MKTKSRLGRGIDAIFPDVIDEEKNQVIEVSVDEIVPNPEQPRTDFDDEKIQELSESIQQHGLISPIILRKNETKYEIIAGERRYRACILAGLDSIPSIVREMPDDDAFKVSLIENLQRENLNPMEEAEAYYSLTHKFGLTHKDIAESVSKDRSTITNALRLVGLPEEVKLALRQQLISNGHARAILMLEDPKAQTDLLNMILTKRLSVRETEKIASEGKKKSPKKKNSHDPYMERLSNMLSEKLSANVVCTWGKKKGKITIEVTNRDDMERIIGELSNVDMPL